MAKDLYVYETQLITSEVPVNIAAGQVYTQENALVFSTGRQIWTKAGMNGEFSVWLKFSGSGTLKVEASCSGNGADFITQSTIIGAVLTAGVHLLPFSIPLCSELKLVLTEDGGAAAVDVEELTIFSR